MYQHLLVPLDGSELSERAAQSSLALASKLGAVKAPEAPTPYVVRVVSKAQAEPAPGSAAAHAEAQATGTPLADAIGKAHGKARSLLTDLSALRLEPTDEDIAELQADGYLGEVLAELRAGQDGPDGEVARDALALLAGLLDERRSVAR